MVIPPVLCVTGPSGVGKTHVLEHLIGSLTARGLRVGAIKHCRHLDAPASDKDADRLARAGASPAIAAAKTAIGIQNSSREPLLLDLVATFCPDCDLVLAEGYKRSVHDKILIRPAGESDGPPSVESVRTVFENGGPGRTGRDEIEAVCQWVWRWFRRRQALREGLIGAVLTGGASRRMGADKSRLRIAGRCILGRLCELMADRIGQVMVIGREPQEPDVPACARWHPDSSPGLGPLGGIATALQVAAAAAAPRGVCVAACDMPAVGGDLLDHLLAGRDPKAPATVPVNPATGQIEPLLAIYEAQARQSVEQAVRCGKLSATDWLTAAGARRLAVPDNLAGQLANVNTPAELKALSERLEQDGA